MYRIDHSNGRKSSGYETLAAAIAQLTRDYNHIKNLEIDSDAEGTVARDLDDHGCDDGFLARVVDVDAEHRTRWGL